MIEVNFESENDIWKLFRTTTLPENGHELSLYEIPLKCCLRVCHVVLFIQLERQ